MGRMSPRSDSEESAEDSSSEEWTENSSSSEESTEDSSSSEESTEDSLSSEESTEDSSSSREEAEEVFGDDFEQVGDLFSYTLCPIWNFFFANKRGFMFCKSATKISPSINTSCSFPGPKGDR